VDDAHTTASCQVPTPPHDQALSQLSQPNRPVHVPATATLRVRVCGRAGRHALERATVVGVRRGKQTKIASRKGRGGEGGESAGPTGASMRAGAGSVLADQGPMRQLIKAAPQLLARPWPHHPTQARGCVGRVCGDAVRPATMELWMWLFRTARSRPTRAAGSSPGCRRGTRSGASRLTLRLPVLLLL